MNLKDLENNIELGRKIFESVPEKARPGWGITLLQVFDNYIDNIPPQIRELEEVTADEENWTKAHAQFTKIRTFSLDNPDYKPEAFILLAEKVAKITYNSSGLPAPFDSDSGWWIAINAKKTADYFGSKDLIDEVRKILTINMTNKYKW